MTKRTIKRPCSVCCPNQFDYEINIYFKVMFRYDHFYINLQSCAHADMSADMNRSMRIFTSQSESSIEISYLAV